MAYTPRLGRGGRKSVEVRVLSPAPAQKERLKRNLSQGNVVRILGVQRTYTNSPKGGAINPSFMTVQKAYRAFGAKVKNLIE